MRRNSVRVRLTLWNVAVLAFVLAAFGVSLFYSLRAALASSIDRELQQRGRGFAARWENRPPDAPRGGFPTLPGFGGGGGRGGGSRTTEAERRGFFRRARILDIEGQPMLPFGDGPWDLELCHLSAAGREAFSEVSFEGEPLRVISVPLRRAGNVEGVVQYAHSLQEMRRVEQGLMWMLVTFIPIALLVCAFSGVFLTERALRPVREVTQAAAQIGAEDLSRRLEVRGDDELAELSSTFNGMIGRLEDAFRRLEGAYEELERSYEQQRRFTGDASHELRTPLTRLKAMTSLSLHGERTPAEYRKALQVADDAADAMNRLVEDLLLLARSDSGQLGLRVRPTALAPVLRQAMALAASGQGAAVRLDVDASIAVEGDPDHLARLFINLIQNALRHTPADGEVRLEAERTGDRVRVRVRDTGEGIPPEHLPHVCERFYRVDASRTRSQGGTGLGLAICRSIVQAHGGEMLFESEVGRGTTVTVTLAAATLPVAAAAPEAVGV